MPSLREQVAEGVKRSRREAAEKQPRTGVFTPLGGLSKITFTTRGRRTGLPREKWWLPFAPDGNVLYLLEENGAGADWVRNLKADRNVVVEGVACVGRIVENDPEEARARDLCASRFARRGLLVADLVAGGLVVAFEPAPESET